MPLINSNFLLGVRIIKNEKFLLKLPTAYYVLLVLSLTNKAWENITTHQKNIQYILRSLDVIIYMKIVKASINSINIRAFKQNSTFFPHKTSLLYQISWSLFSLSFKNILLKSIWNRKISNKNKLFKMTFLKYKMPNPFKL